MSIKFIKEEQIFILDTKNTCYQMKIDKTGCLRHLYYGRAVGGTNMDYRYRSADRGFSGNPYEFAADRGCSFDTMPQEYSGSGVGDYRVSSIMVENADGSGSIDLRYRSHRISAGKYRLEDLPYVREGKDTVSTLVICLEDPVTQITVELLYGVFEEKDVITRAVRVKNASEKRVFLRKAASVCLDFPYGISDLIHFSGRHCMERGPERQELAQNIVTVGSRRGMSSHHNNPFVILCDSRADEDQGNCYGIMLMYSGGHKEEIEKDQFESVRVTAGIQDDGFRWQMDPGEVFETPEAILSFSWEGMNGLSGHYHRLIRENICDPAYLTKKKPVLFNSWEACYFHFTEENILQLAREAKDLGADMIVMDDGWFGDRNDDHRGLGDWYVNEKKIRGGLRQLVDKVKDLGLKFGIWVEPEMINEDSDLYRSHPDWALAEPGRHPVKARDQLVLDMSRKDVQDYLFDSITGLLETADIEYIKWDFNRCVSNLYSGLLPASRQGETAHRFVLGTYSLLSRIKEACPDVLIEGCAGGGGRFDAGMLFYTPQIWCSDNTDPIARLKIQKGTSYGYPVCCMGSHVSASPNHQTGRETPLKTRGIVASSAVLGYELNTALLCDEEREQIREQIRTYHSYYWLIHNGRYYRLGDRVQNKRYTCWEYVSENQSEVLVNIVAFDWEANAPFPCIHLRGLREDYLYRLDGRQMKVSGAALMYGGYTLDFFTGNYPAVQLHFTRVEE